MDYHNPNLPAHKKEEATTSVARILNQLFNRYHRVWSKGHRIMALLTRLNRKRVGKWLRVIEDYGLIKTVSEYRWNGDDDKAARQYEMSFDFHKRLLFARTKTARFAKSRGSTISSLTKKSLSSLHEIPTVSHKKNIRRLTPLQNSEHPRKQQKEKKDPHNNLGIRKLFHLFYDLPGLITHDKWKTKFRILPRDMKQYIYVGILVC